MENTKEAYDELAFYTLSHPDPSFIHQHLVDAYAAQYADENTKPITLTFALVGLYLAVEKNYSGRAVQQFHMLLSSMKPLNAKNSKAVVTRQGIKTWPKFILPATRGEITLSHVLAIPPEPDRDRMIFSWCKGVWAAYKKDNIETVKALIEPYLPTSQ